MEAPTGHSRYRYSSGVADLPWDCVVLGIPKSVQAKAASIVRWRAQVQAAAMAAWPVDDPPLDHEVQIHVTYYHDGAPLDVDNMLKPIQDALCGIAYKDDNQLTDTHGHLRDLNAQYRVRGMTQRRPGRLHVERAVRAYPDRTAVASGRVAMSESSSRHSFQQQMAQAIG